MDCQRCGEPASPQVASYPLCAACWSAADRRARVGCLLISLAVISILVGYSLLEIIMEILG